MRRMHTRSALVLAMALTLAFSAMPVVANSPDIGPGQGGEDIGIEPPPVGRDGNPGASLSPTGGDTQSADADLIPDSADAVACLVWGSISRGGRWLIWNSGSQVCSGPELWSQSVTVYLDRCAVLAFGVCIFWNNWGQAPTCNKLGEGLLRCPAAGEFAWIVNEGTYKTRVKGCDDSAFGPSCSSWESTSVLIEP